MKYAGADWIKDCLHRGMSPIGEKVADILGFVWLGIYHLDTKALQNTDWGDDYCIEVLVYGGLATWDFNRLTALVVCCHDAAVRVEVSPCNGSYLRLQFHQRKREGGTWERHPTMEEAVVMIRSAFETAEPVP